MVQAALIAVLVIVVFVLLICIFGILRSPGPAGWASQTIVVPNMQNLQRGDIPPPDWPVLPHNQTQGSAPGHPNWQSNAAVILLAVLICIVIVVSYIIGIWIRNGRPAPGALGRMWERVTRRPQNASLGGAAPAIPLSSMQTGMPGAVVQGPAQVPGVQNPVAQAQAAQNQTQASNTGATTQTQMTNQDQGLENTRSSGSSETTVVGRTEEEEHAYLRSLIAAGSAPGVRSLAGSP
ncbi:hypothetical protein LTR56_001569 [Elasticomyces elasticus]|nr:hypothetical protein LTR56_001569 [Elasticomyces elasticus]KAK3667379.1 hypothetical protein LTR22_001895 [Elasticomyces elasticus]KAK4932541.1 hypothetical protein LTR49_000965 [Elasticomyces elasticus]KAK5769563.1 hypothetical protein LTS12_000013 [Elasticomyces elasticus]